MRVLIVSIQYAPEITGNAGWVTGLARALTSRGFDLAVFAGTPHYRLPRVPRRYLFRPYLRETLDGVKILRCWAFPASDGLWAKILNYGTFTLTCFPAALFTCTPDVLLIVSPPPWLGLIGVALKALRGCPFIYYNPDLLPEAYVASREIRFRWMISLLDRLQRFLYRRSDRIAVPTPSFCQIIASKGVPPGKVVAVPLFLGTLSIAPRPKRNPFSERLGLTEKFVVMYAGNVGYIHGAEVLAEVAERLAQFAEVILLVVGDGSKKKDLVRRAEKKKLRNIMFLPPQPEELLPDLLSTADVFVVTTRRGAGKTSFPNRLHAYLLAARPVVAALDAYSDAAMFVQRAGCGFVTEPENPQALCQAIETLYRDPGLRADCGQKGRVFMERHFSTQSITDQYEQLLRAAAQR